MNKKLSQDDYLRRCSKVPIERATKVPTTGGAWDVRVDRWWIIVDDCILFFDQQSPQCNSSKQMMQSLRDELCPDAEVRFLPVVYREHRCEK